MAYDVGGRWGRDVGSINFADGGADAWGRVLFRESGLSGKGLVHAMEKAMIATFCRSRIIASNFFFKSLAAAMLAGVFSTFCDEWRSFSAL